MSGSCCTARPPPLLLYCAAAGAAAAKGEAGNGGDGCCCLISVKFPVRAMIVAAQVLACPLPFSPLARQQTFINPALARAVHCFGVKERAQAPGCTELSYGVQTLKAYLGTRGRLLAAMTSFPAMVQLH